MKWFGSNTTRRRRLGVGLFEDGVSLVELSEAQGKQVLHQCAYSDCRDTASRIQCLEQLVKQHKLKNCLVDVVLDPALYSLLQVEAPEVEPEELSSAIRWRVKDLIDFHIDDAVIDLFEMPESRRQGMARMMSVAAVRSSEIQNIVDMFGDTGLKLNSIDIHELCVRNLMARVYPADTVQALLYVGQTHSSVDITMGEHLYLSRRLAFNATDFEAQGAPDEELMDNLVLELQRSLDYYESHYGMGAANGVAVSMPAVHQEAVIDYADRNLLIPAGALPLQELITGLEGVEDELLIRSIPVIGAAMRAA